MTESEVTSVGCSAGDEFRKHYSTMLLHVFSRASALYVLCLSPLLHFKASPTISEKRSLLCTRAFHVERLPAYGGGLLMLAVRNLWVLITICFGA